MTPRPTDATIAAGVARGRRRGMALGLCAFLALVAAPIEIRPAVASDVDHRAKSSPASAERTAAASYSFRVMGFNLVGMTITNYGFIGNNFNSRNASFEYPLGLGFEHLVRGGLWVGAHAINQENGVHFTGVTTATVDGSTSDTSPEATEFTPFSSAIVGRSKLPEDSTYSLSAVSHHDFISYFDDKTPKRSGNNPETHRPLNISVRQENYTWTHGDYQHFKIFHYVIHNDGLQMDSVWVGIYGELSSGFKGGYSTWPPTSGGGGALGGWFSKKYVAYDDTLRAFMEHYCNAGPAPDNCMLERVPYWVGYKLLTPPDTSKHQNWTLAAWKYDPQDTVGARDEDSERYAIMSAGTRNPLVGDSLAPTTGDPVELVAIGPFGDAANPILPGDSVVVDFAFIGGGTQDDFRAHARAAQRAYDLHYNVAEPPPSPKLRVVARDQALDLYWNERPEKTKDPTSAAPESLDFEGYRVYLGVDRLDPQMVAQIDLATSPHDTTGFNTGLDSLRLPRPIVVDGDTVHYKFTVRGLRNGFKYFAAVSSYDLGTAEDPSLDSGILQNKVMAIPGPAKSEGAGGDAITVFPNPYRVEARWDQGSLVRDHYLWFANLPEKCTLRIFTLAGDLIFETGFDGATYDGSNARGIYYPPRDSDVRRPTLSGRTFGWNLITKDGQAAATGLYLYSVEDASGKRTVGKFLVVKSDRESF